MENNKEYKETEYGILIRELQQEFHKLKIQFSKYQKKHSNEPIFNEYQKEIYDYITTDKKEACLRIYRGNSYLTVHLAEGYQKEGKGVGLKHILLGHFGKTIENIDKRGNITAKDILNIANVIKKGRELTDAEIKENKNGEDKLIGFQLEKNFNLKKEDNEKTFLRVLLSKKENGRHIVTFFSTDDGEEVKL